MKRLLLILTVIMLAAAPATYAQHRSQRGQGEETSSRAEWLSEMRQYKRTYLSRELNLTPEQQAKFFPIYEEMEDKSAQAEEEARKMESRVSALPEATDTEYTKTAEALYDSKVKSAQIEREYLDRFRTILTPRQLFELKGAERRFAREMMRRHNDIRRTRAHAEGK